MLVSLLPSACKRLGLLACLFAPAAAAAEIYIWTDERGTTVISDTRPENPRALKNVEVVRDSERDTRKGTGPREVTRTEQALLERIDSLERQVRSQTYASPPAAPPPPAYSETYYTSPPPPAYDPYYTSYPGYYPSYYVPSYSYIVPRRVIVGRAFVGRPVAHRGFVHRGRR